MTFDAMSYRRKSIVLSGSWPIIMLFYKTPRHFLFIKKIYHGIAVHINFVCIYFVVIQSAYEVFDWNQAVC